MTLSQVKIYFKPWMGIV